VNVLKLAGYLRGNSLSPNNLVHLPGYGDFQLKQIEIITDPFPLKKRYHFSRFFSYTLLYIVIKTSLADTGMLYRKVKPGKQMDTTTGSTILQVDLTTRDDLEEENFVEVSHNYAINNKT